MIKIYIIYGILSSNTYTFIQLSSLPYSTSYLLPKAKKKQMKTKQFQ